MVKVISNSQKIVVKKISIFTRLVVTLLLMIGVFVSAFAIIYFKSMFIFAAPTNFEECASQKTSQIQQTYPSICVSRDGRRFLEPLSEIEQKLLESPFKEGERAKNENQFCGGIANIPCSLGYTCQQEGNNPEAGGKCIKDNE